jgi:hypothetical protein
VIAISSGCVLVGGNYVHPEQLLVRNWRHMIVMGSGHRMLSPNILNVKLGVDNLVLRVVAFNASQEVDWSQRRTNYRFRMTYGVIHSENGV